MSGKSQNPKKLLHSSIDDKQSKFQFVASLTEWLAALPWQDRLHSFVGFYSPLHQDRRQSRGVVTGGILFNLSDELQESEGDLSRAVQERREQLQKSHHLGRQQDRPGQISGRLDRRYFYGSSINIDVPSNPNNVRITGNPNPNLLGLLVHLMIGLCKSIEKSIYLLSTNVCMLV
ncbi:hypothetical protein GQR58_029420 [Nymphon striatum]|nr:hypothetical protein GQR58_029420 [Nymphon striatum]